MIGFANYGTVVELLSHLAAPDSSDGRASAAGAARLVAHCTEYDGAVHVVRFIASPLGQVTRYLFGHTPVQEEDADGFGAVLGRWVHDPAFRDSAIELVQEIRAETAAKRAAYVEMLWETVVKTVSPHAEQWSDVAKRSDLRDQLLAGVRAGEGAAIIANGMVREAALVAGRELSETEERRLTDSVLVNFRTMIEYRSLIVEKLISGGPNMTKRSRANGVFDQVVCGATGGLARIRNCPVLVVSNDGDILEAARRADMTLEIVSPEEYRSLLERNPDDFNDHVTEIFRKQAARKVDAPVV